MGYPPPPDAPPVPTQVGIEADAGMAPSPSGPALCGFGIPVFSFSIAFKLPPFPPFPFPPVFNFFVALNCDLSNPLDASVSFGGGRVSNIDPDADDEFVEG